MIVLFIPFKTEFLQGWKNFFYLIIVSILILLMVLLLEINNKIFKICLRFFLCPMICASCQVVYGFPTGWLVLNFYCSCEFINIIRRFVNIVENAFIANRLLNFIEISDEGAICLDLWLLLSLKMWRFFSWLGFKKWLERKIKIIIFSFLRVNDGELDFVLFFPWRLHSSNSNLYLFIIVNKNSLTNNSYQHQPNYSFSSSSSSS